MMNFKQLLLHVNARPFIDQARFGIEREGQRVDLAGNLAKTDHPAIAHKVSRCFQIKFCFEFGKILKFFLMAEQCS